MQQFEPDLSAALLTARENFACFQCDFVHEAMGLVINAVNATLGYTLPWLKTPHTFLPRIKNRAASSPGQMQVLTLQVVSV